MRAHVTLKTFVEIGMHIFANSNFHLAMKNISRMVFAVRTLQHYVKQQRLQSVFFYN